MLACIGDVVLMMASIKSEACTDQLAEWKTLLQPASPKTDMQLLGLRHKGLGMLNQMLLGQDGFRCGWSPQGGLQPAFVLTHSHMLRYSGIRMQQSAS